jgi:hypothetical protein
MKKILRDQFNWQYQKTWMPFIPWSGTINYLLKGNRDPGDIPSKSRLYYSWYFRHETALSQMRSKMSQCRQKSDQVQAILYRFWQDLVGFFNCFITMDETWIHIHIRSRDQRTITGMETQWFPAFKRSKHRSNWARYWHLSSGTKMEFCF